MMFRTLFLALILSTTSAHAEDAARTITVTGSGSVAIAPDMATVSVGARHEAPTAAEALAMTSNGVSAAISVLQDAGVEDTDIQTSGLSVSPRWQRVSNDPDRPPEVTGYIASNTLTVAIRNLDSLGAVLDAVVQDGVNTLGGISFGLQEQGATLDEARRRAVADALATARVLSDAAGVSLGQILSISEAGSGVPQPRMMMEAAMADAVPVAAGELTVSARVTVIYGLVD